MGNLFASLRGATSALNVFERELATVQNNVSNASTPGYAKQTQTLTANTFDLNNGLIGGVSVGPVVSTRSEYAEQAVRRQNEYYGAYEQKSSDLSQIQAVFDISDGAGIPGALSSFFDSCSALSESPNDTSARQTVLDQAGEVARSFGETASSLNTAGQAVNGEIQSNVDQFNQLTGELRDLNAARQQNFQAGSDAGADAKIHDVLEQLSGIANVTALQQSDGSYTLLLGGQIPVVSGNQQHAISADMSGSPALLLDAQGKDITAKVTLGRLGSLMEVKNQTLPSLMDGLNTLAAGVADQVNETLAGGVDQNGNVPVKQLFTYDTTGGAASTLAVTDMTPEEIPSALPEGPGGNGNALNLAALASAKLPNGQTFNDAFSEIAATVGRDLNTASANADTHGQLLNQAKDLRTQISGVSLDEEATNLIEFQRSYQAAAKLVSVLNDMTNSLIQMISGT